ncbi:uncharacterized protein [Dysidea avara]|uniref:uncharacterized protein n=1 Tax=Dysidea avara TaxID=196820 RepID=UPI00332AA17B
MATNSRKRGQTAAKEISEVGQPKKKRQRKVMTKKTRETLQSSLKSIDTTILVQEAVARIREEFDSESSSLVNELCAEQQLLQELVEFHRDTFVALHIECKKEKNSQLKFQLRWLSLCSTFLLEEQYSLADINLEESTHPVLTELRQKWIHFCKKHCSSITASKPIMMSFSSSLYNSLLEHVASFQTRQTEGTSGGTVVPTAEEDGVYYRFGGGALCEMLHRRYKQIRTASNKNLMSIEISLLQAINTKDKSDIPEYLQYQDRGYMYFPHKTFIPFLRKLDTDLKKLVNVESFHKLGNDLIKITHDGLKEPSYKDTFVAVLKQRLPDCILDSETQTAMDNVFDELTRKLCNTRIQEFLSATKQEFATKKGMASTVDVNLRTTLLSDHTKLSSKVDK